MARRSRSRRAATFDFRTAFDGFSTASGHAANDFGPRGSAIVTPVSSSAETATDSPSSRPARSMSAANSSAPAPKRTPSSRSAAAVVGME